MAVDNQWVADIEFRIDAARTVAELKRIEEELSDAAQSAGDSSDAFDALSSRITTAMDRASQEVSKATNRITSELSSWKQQFNEDINLSFATGDDSGGLQRMEAMLKTNRSEVEAMIAAHRTLGATAPQAYQQVTAEMARQEQALERLNAAQEARKIGQYTADMSRLEKANFNLTRSTQELAEAERELANTPTTASTGDLTAARNRVADATDKVTAAEREWDQALRSTQGSYDRMEAAMNSYRQTVNENESGLSRAAIAAQRFEEAYTAAGRAVDKAKDAYDNEDLRNMDRYAREAAAAVKELETAYVQSNRASAAEAQKLEQAQERLAQSFENLNYGNQASQVNSVSVAEQKLAAAKRRTSAAVQEYNAAIASGNTDAVITATNRLATAQNEQARAAQNLSRAQDEVVGREEANRYALYEVGTTYLTIAASITAAGTATLKAAADMESGMIGIQRTSGASAEEMVDLEASMIDLIQTMPVAADELLAMAERAGQLGIAAEDVDNFTESTSKLVAISDTLSATEAAEYLGRIANLTGMKNTADGFQLLADSIAAAGVEAAATDQEIAETAEEVAMAAAGANFAADEVIGLATAFASLGVPPERARSVIQNLVTVMNTGLRGANDSIQQSADIMGITAEKAAALWEHNPTEFIAELARSMQGFSGAQVGQALADIGIEGMRAVPVMQAIIQDFDSAAAAGEGVKSVFETAIDTANFENAAGTLDEMFAPVMESLAGKFQIFLNSVIVAGAAVGGVLAPAAVALLDIVTPLVQMFSEFVATPIGSFLTGAVGLIAGAVAAFTAFRGALALSTAAMLAFRQTANQTIGLGMMGQVKMLATTFGQVTGATNLYAAASARAADTSTRGLKATIDGNGRLVTSLSRVRGAVGTAFNAVGGWPTLILAAVAAITAMAVEWNKAGVEVSELENRMGDLYTGATDLTSIFRTSASDMENFFGMGSSAVSDYAGDIAELIPLLDDLNAIAGKVPQWTFGDHLNIDAESVKNLRNLRTDLQKFDEQLAQMDFSNMAMGFASIVEASDGSRESLLAILDTMEDVRNAAEVQYELQYNVDLDMNDAEDRLTLATYLMNQAEGAAVGLSGSFTDAELEAAEFAAAIDDIAASLKAYNDELWAASNAEYAFQDALAGAQELLSSGEYSLNQAALDFDYLTEAGKNTQQAFQDIASGATDAAASILEAGGSAEDAEAKLQEGRQGFYDLALEILGSAEAAQEFTDKWYGVPENLLFELLTNGTIDTANMSTEELLTLLDDLPPNTDVKVTGLTDQAIEDIEAVGYEVTHLPDGTVVVTSETKKAREGFQRLYNDWNGINLFWWVNWQETGTRRRGGSASRSANGGYVYASGGHAGYAGGGQVGYYTGQGGKWDPAGIVHRGEYVIPKWGVDQSTGLPKADILGRLTKGSPSAGRDRGYANGGLASGSILAGGIVDLGPSTIRAIADAVQPMLELDGKMVAENTSRQYSDFSRAGAM